jgi:hypothetical protein
MNYKLNGNEWDLTIASPLSQTVRDFNSINKDRSRHISAYPFLRNIKRSLGYLAVEYNVKLVVVARCALHNGIKFLWCFGEDIEKIKDCKQRIHKTGNTDILGMLETNHFDLGKSNFARFNGRFDEDDLSMCEGIAHAVGLSKSVIYQIAIAAGLLPFEQLTGYENQFFYCLLVSFKKWLQDRSCYALQMAEFAEKNAQPQIEGPFRSLNDVLEHSDNKRIQ